MFRSMKVTLLECLLKSHVSPMLFIRCWKSSHCVASSSGSGSRSQMPKPSSMNLRRKRSCDEGKGVMWVSSLTPAKRLAIEVGNQGCWSHAHCNAFVLVGKNVHKPHVISAQYDLKGFNDGCC